MQRENAEAMAMWAGRALKAEELLRESQAFIGGDWRQRRDELLAASPASALVTGEGE
jgi:hypothetical protein